MVRLGKIAFANCDFPYFGIEHGGVEAKDLAICEAHPVKLAQMIRDNELDISPISSIMYAKIDDLLILPSISITSNDFTKSVLICSNGNLGLSDFEGKTLCIPETTASSSSLIQIIFRLKGINVNIKHCRGSDIDTLLSQGDAALLIGDSALHAVGKYRVVADLGNEWKKITGMKMVYALWVVREKYAKDHPDTVKYVLDCLLRSKDYAYGNIDMISKSIGEKKQLSDEFMTEYLHTLNYDFDDKSIDSLRLYFRYAYKCGLIDRVPEIRFFT